MHLRNLQVLQTYCLRNSITGLLVYFLNGLAAGAVLLFSKEKSDWPVALFFLLWNFLSGCYHTFENLLLCVSVGVLVMLYWRTIVTVTKITCSFSACTLIYFNFESCLCAGLCSMPHLRDPTSCFRLFFGNKEKGPHIDAAVHCRIALQLGRLKVCHIICHFRQHLSI